MAGWDIAGKNDTNPREVPFGRRSTCSLAASSATKGQLLTPAELRAHFSGACDNSGCVKCGPWRAERLLLPFASSQACSSGRSWQRSRSSKLRQFARDRLVRHRLLLRPMHEGRDATMPRNSTSLVRVVLVRSRDSEYLDMRAVSRIRHRGVEIDPAQYPVVVARANPEAVRPLEMLVPELRALSGFEKVLRQCERS